MKKANRPVTTRTGERSQSDGKRTHAVMPRKDVRFLGAPPPKIAETDTWAPKWLDWPVIEGDAIVTSDPHLPYHSADMIGKALAIAERFGISTFVNVGDLVDFEALSSFDHENQKADPLVDINAAKRLLAELGERFERSVLLMGNHEKRLERKLDFKLLYSKLSSDWVPEKFRSTITLSRYPYCEIISNGEKYRVTHPKSYSRISARVPTQLCSKFLCHVLGAHGHHQGFSMDASGQYIGADLGGLFDQEKHTYVMLNDTTHPKWNPGFAMIRNGALYLFGDNPAMTDWEFWLGE